MASIDVPLCNDSLRCELERLEAELMCPPHAKGRTQASFQSGRVISIG